MVEHSLSMCVALSILQGKKKINEVCVVPHTVTPALRRLGREDKVSYLVNSRSAWKTQ